MGISVVGISVVGGVVGVVGSTGVGISVVGISVVGGVAGI